MDQNIISTIANIVLLLIIILIAVVSIISIYVLVRYGRSRSITITSSLVFIGVLVLQSIAAFTTLQLIL